LLNWAEKIILFDSNSTHNKIKIAENAGIEIIKFNYTLGGRKKDNVC
jgi:uncharacterized HAD superfamily protein